jgi:hypothetical protein
VVLAAGYAKQANAQADAKLTQAGASVVGSRTVVT